MPRMTRKRPGYKTLGLDVPQIVWDAIEKKAQEAGISASKLITQLLADGTGVPRSKLPKPQKPGPKKPD